MSLAPSVFPAADLVRKGDRQRQARGQFDPEVERVRSSASEFANLVHSAGESVERYFETLSDHEPGSNSVAAIERVELPEASDVLSSRDAHVLPFVTIQVPTDCLRAVRSLVLSGPGGSLAVHRYAVFAVLRVAIETSATTWWISEITIDAEERLGRVLRLTADWHRRRGTHISSGNRAAKHADLTLRTAQHHGLLDVLTRDESGTLKVKRPPNYIDQIEKMYLAHGAKPGIGKAIYSRLSEFTHMNLFGVMSGFSGNVTTRSGLRGREPTVPFLDIVQAAREAAVTTQIAGQTYISLMGWDQERWRALVEPAIQEIEVFGAAFLDEEPP